MPIDNNRAKRVTFTRPLEAGSAIVHGFAG